MIRDFLNIRHRRFNVAALALSSFAFTHLALSALAQAEPEPAKKVVAVLPFSSPSEYSEMGRNAQDTFVTQLVKAQTMRIVQSDMVMKTLSRVGLQWTGVISPQVLRATKERLQADYVLVGKMRWGGDAYILSVHVMNVKSLETTMAEDIDFRDGDRMRIAVRTLAKKMAGVISGTGTGAGGDSKAELFLNVDARAFYDTADACIEDLSALTQHSRFTGTVDSHDEDKKMIVVKAYRTLEPGTPLDIFSGSDDLDGPQRAATAYVTKSGGGKIEAQYKSLSGDGIELQARVSNEEHQWVIAVGDIVDEVEENEKLVEKFKATLQEKISEGSELKLVNPRAIDWSNRRAALTRLANQGVELLVEGKFYGTAGARRAEFKVYSTQTAKLWGKLQFETRL